MGTKSEWGPCMSEYIAWVIISIPYLFRVFSYFNEMKKNIYICKVWACYVVKGGYRASIPSFWENENFRANVVCLRIEFRYSTTD